MVRIFDKYDSGFDEELESTPEELLVQMGRSDESAFEEFYHRFQGFGMKVILDVVDDFGKAEEVFNDSMLKLYRYSPSFDESNGSALSLFKVIAKRAAIDRIRGKRILFFAEDPYSFLEGQSAWDSRRSPAAEAEFVSDIKNLEDSIGKLSPALRKSIKILYETGMSYSQIAEKQRLPLGSVKSSIRRGLVALRALGVS